MRAALDIHIQSSNLDASHTKMVNTFKLTCTQFIVLHLQPSSNFYKYVLSIYSKMSYNQLLIYKLGVALYTCLQCDNTIIKLSCATYFNVLI